jgi:excisionase family DNA binding protein
MPVTGSGAFPLLLTATQAAAALGVGRTKLYELIRDGTLHPVHIGRSVRIPADDLRLFVGRLQGEGALSQARVADRSSRPLEAKSDSM